MKFEPGNQFWRQRSSHGRDALFASADLLWQAASEYFQWCDENPWIKIEYNGKDADRCEVPTARPYTLSGLCSYLGCGRTYLYDFKKSKTLNADFSDVITRIEEIIWTQKFEGATVGAYNANIIARDLGLIEKKSIENPTNRNVRVDRDSEGNVVILEEADEDNAE